MGHKTCQMCSTLRQVCVHDPGKTTIQCWQGKHSGTCSNFCICDCHKGAYPLDSPPPVTQEEVEAAIASIKEVHK